MREIFVNTINVEISSEYAGKRIDIVLSELVEGLSRTRAAALCEDGAVTLGNKKISKKHITSMGECYTLVLPQPKQLSVEPQEIPLDIVYEDEDLLVINKPKGLVVHPAPGNESNTLVNALMHHCKGSLSGIGGVLRPGIVHRIDKDTTGLLLVAKNDFSHSALSKQIAEHSLDRYYIAIVHGGFSEENFVIDKPIARHRLDRKRMAIDFSGKSAVTHVNVLESNNGYSLIKCRLQTGRTHQIRVHLASISHPLVGDSTYLGSRKTIAGTEGQCLHAGAIGFLHPSKNERLYFSVSPPRYFVDLAKKLSLCLDEKELIL